MLQAAFQVHEDMQKHNIQPDIRTFNALINAAGKHQLSAIALSFYSQLCTKKLQPTAHTYSLTFQAFCHGAHDHGSWLLQVSISSPVLL